MKYNHEPKSSCNTHVYRMILFFIELVPDDIFELCIVNIFVTRTYNFRSNISKKKSKGAWAVCEWWVIINDELIG